MDALLLFVSSLASYSVLFIDGESIVVMSKQCPSDDQVQLYRLLSMTNLTKGGVSVTRIQTYSGYGGGVVHVGHFCKMHPPDNDFQKKRGWSVGWSLTGQYSKVTDVVLESNADVCALTIIIISRTLADYASMRTHCRCQSTHQLTSVMMII